MSDADEERIIADMHRRLRLRAVLGILVCGAAIATEFILIMGFHVITWPVRWQAFLEVSAVGALVGLGGVTAAWWATRLPPEALTTRITLRHSDRVQRILSWVYLFYPLILGFWAFDTALVVHRVLQDGWNMMDVTEGFAFAGLILGYVPFLAGWSRDRRARLIFDEELFRSFRTRGYVAGFWSVLVGLMLILALGLARPAWAVEALPALIAVGISVPAVTIALLNRRAERDG